MAASRPSQPRSTLLAQQAVANHVVYTADLRRPTELGAQQRDDLARWVSNRLNHRWRRPTCQPSGYSYMGGRLAATPDGPAGLFMYDDPKGVRLTVFVLPLSAAASMPIQQVDSLQRRWLRLDRQECRLHGRGQAAARGSAPYRRDGAPATERRNVSTKQPIAIADPDQRAPNGSGAR